MCIIDRSKDVLHVVIVHYVSRDINIKHKLP